MNKFVNYNRIFGLLLLMIVICSQAMAGDASHEQLLMRYTKARPLVIVASWNFAPYEFRNSKGDMDGFNIELIKALLDREDIPYRYKMMKWNRALQMFDRNEVQLYVKIERTPNTPYLGNSIIAPYRICAVHKKNIPLPKDIEHPAKGVIYGFVYKGYGLNTMKARGLDTTNIRIYKTFEEGLYALHDGKCDFFFDAEEPMKWDIKEMQLDDLCLSGINLPVLSLKFCSKDSALLDVLDRAYATFVQTAEYSDLCDKWFHPEQNKQKASNTLALVIVIVLIMVMFIAIIIKIMKTRLKLIKDDTRYAHEKIVRVHLLMEPSSLRNDETLKKVKEEEYDLIVEKFRKIFELAPNCLSINTPDGFLLEANAPMKRLFQLENKNEDYLRIVNLFTLPPLKGYLQPGELTESISSCEEFHNYDTGECKYLERTITPIKDDQGKIRFIALEISDLTDERARHQEQKELMKKVRETNSMMKKYEEEMAYLFNSSNIYSWSYDFCTHIVSFQTDPSHPLFKMSIEELLTFVIKENDETDEHMIERLDAAASHPYTMQLKGKNIFDKEEKSVHIYTISSMPQYDKNDNVCGAFGIWLDITSRMNAREKLKHEMELANQSVRMKSMFMASLSHEIRTPLNSIVGFSEILHTIQDENERKQIFDIIDSNCDILLRLINDILAASDKETNLKIEPKDIEFVKCFKEICQVLKQRVDLSGVEFIMDSPCDEIRARLDIERLQQVLTNFVTNAVKYTKKGHIKVGYEFDGKILYIYCEDTGTGIPKDKQNMVFEQFVKLNDFVQGTGLGLSICKQIVEMSGGEIGVDSTVGKGSTFWMKIPVE